MSYRRGCTAAPTTVVLRAAWAILLAVPAASFAQAWSFADRHPLSIAMGFSEGALAGPLGRDAVGDLAAVSAGYELFIGARLSVRGELAYAQKGGFVAGADGFASMSVADGLVTIRGVQLPVLARYYLSDGFFVSGGGAVGVPLSCEVDQEDEARTFFGRTITSCVDWTGVPFGYRVDEGGEVAERPRVFTRNFHERTVLGAVGFSAKAFDLEVRYDHAVHPVLNSKSGGLKSRTLTMMVHWRPAGIR